jgi:hypothetical protein
VWFDEPDAARRFAAARGVNRLIDTDRHVSSNWLSVLGRRTFVARFDPWRNNKIDYVDACPPHDRDPRANLQCVARSRPSDADHALRRQGHGQFAPQRSGWSEQDAAAGTSERRRSRLNDE